MSGSNFASFTLLLLGLVGGAHLLGHLFTRLRQPRVAGEILAGVILGSSGLERFSPRISAALLAHQQLDGSDQNQIVLGFLSNLGLLLLMFASGTETGGLFDRNNRREIAWLGTVGTGLPFVAVLILLPMIPTTALAGRISQPAALLMIVGIAMAVTSIPVISKILHDLNVLHTRFARLVLGVAVIEDIVLWAVLAVATALAKSGTVPNREIVIQILATLIYFVAGFTVMPRLLRAVGTAKWNVIATSSPVGYIIIILLAYSALASLCHVNLVFAAFLAGYGSISTTDVFKDAVKTISKVSFAVFIPMYFAIVGYQLDLSKAFSFKMFALFLASGCIVKLAATGLGARLAGFNWNDSLNLAMAFNARGGPGIVLASVAFDAGIISSFFYSTLVLFAVLTSQIAGAWLDYVVRRGLPLLSGQVEIPAVSSREEFAS